MPSSIASAAHDVARLDDFSDETIADDDGAAAGGGPPVWQGSMPAANEATAGAAATPPHADTQPTVARAGMDWLARYCLQKQQQYGARSHAPTARQWAYKAYSMHVMDAATGQVKPLPSQRGRPTADITAHTLPGARWKTDTSAHHATPTHPQRKDEQYKTLHGVEDAGKGARFSLTSEMLLGAGNSADMNVAYRQLGAVAQQAMLDSKTVCDSKVMRRDQLPRPDHAVVYTTVLGSEERDVMGNWLASQMIGASRCLPIGMHPLMPGVGYAEVQTDILCADGRFKLAPGSDEPNQGLSSLGVSRAAVIERALRDHGDRPVSELGATLTAALIVHNYDPVNPAFIAQQPAP